MATTTKTRKAPASKAASIPKIRADINRPIMKWQYDQLIKELLLLQGHAADPTCPCKSEGEMCIRKHLLTVEALLSETAAMEKSEIMIGTLNEHYEQTRSLRLNEEKYLCGDEMTGKALQLHDSLAEWARMTRKVYEGYSLACSLKDHKAPAPSPIVEVIAPVPVSEYEVTIAPPEPELGIQVEIIAPAPAPLWTAKDLLLAIYPKYSGEPDDGTFSHELNLAQRRFMQAFKEAKWDKDRFTAVVERLPYDDDRIDYMEKVVEGKAKLDRLTPDESVLVHRMAPRYVKAYNFASALYDLTLTDPSHWKAGDPDFPAPSPANKAQACADMKEGELNHKHFLGVPEHPKTGNHDWHRRWVGIYQNAQRVIGCDCQRS
ncbi:hypothetical protein ABFB09_08065 [Dehalogenimonas sp. THU2]|uniref:hypothetical protein n=1 Tax=Dehalogenimonas sp. THU2 TaxID=3151121 RepID=UPI003218BAE5